MSGVSQHSKKCHRTALQLKRSHQSATRIAITRRNAPRSRAVEEALCTIINVGTHALKQSQHQLLRGNSRAPDQRTSTAGIS